MVLDMTTYSVCTKVVIDVKYISPPISSTEFSFISYNFIPKWTVSKMDTPGC